MRRGMGERARRWLGRVGALALLAVAPAGAEQPIEVWLWAWERPEDLRFVPDDVGVAFLETTLVLDGDAVHDVPRRQPLRVRAGQPLMAVVRIEDDRRAPSRLDGSVRTRIVDHLLAAAAEPGVGAVQIDFDATLSQRESYRALLREARARLPTSTRLSVTALASWCLFDRWIDADPWVVDETVPMLFAMGRETDVVRDHLRSGGALRAQRCQESAGVMLGETWIVPDHVRRVFVFNAEPWTPHAWAEVQRRLG